MRTSQLSLATRLVFPTDRIRARYARVDHMVERDQTCRLCGLLFGPHNLSSALEIESASIRTLSSHHAIHSILVAKGAISEAHSASSSVQVGVCRSGAYLQASVCWTRSSISTGRPRFPFGVFTEGYISTTTTDINRLPCLTKRRST